MFITMLSLKDNTFNKLMNQIVTDFMTAYRWRTKKEKKIINRVYSLFLTIMKEKESIDNNNNE